MEKENKSIFKKITDRLYGGIDMTWPKVIIYAVVTALIAFAALVLPVFKDTSIERIGVHLEAWIFFAVIIMANCKKPLESALKTFVFFLISQPLIYLLQVPFNTYGWGIFSFYGYWFKLTLLTFPAAYIGWYINKKNWLSVLIFTPVIALLAGFFYNAAFECFISFPHLLLTALFCLMQIVLYICVFFPDIRMKAAGALVAAAVTGFMLVRLMQNGIGINTTRFLPEGITVSEDAALEMGESSSAQVTLESTGTDPMVRIQAKWYGTSEFTIKDKAGDHTFIVKIYKDDKGTDQVDIIEKD